MEILVPKTVVSEVIEFDTAYKFELSFSSQPTSPAAAQRIPDYIRTHSVLHFSLLDGRIQMPAIKASFRSTIYILFTFIVFYLFICFIYTLFTVLHLLMINRYIL